MIPCRTHKRILGDLFGLKSDNFRGSSNAEIKPADHCDSVLPYTLPSTTFGTSLLVTDLHRSLRSLDSTSTGLSEPPFFDRCGTCHTQQTDPHPSFLTISIALPPSLVASHTIPPSFDITKASNTVFSAGEYAARGSITILGNRPFTPSSTIQPSHPRLLNPFESHPLSAC